MMQAILDIVSTPGFQAVYLTGLLLAPFIGKWTKSTGRTESILPKDPFGATLLALWPAAGCLMAAIIVSGCLITSVTNAKTIAARTIAWRPHASK